MPKHHQSNRERNLVRLCRALCSLDSEGAARSLLSDLCTTREVDDLAQRLEVAMLLARGASYASVSGETGASSTAVRAAIAWCWNAWGSDPANAPADRCRPVALPCP